MSLISVIINCDSRAGFQENNSVATGIFNGCISEDFLTDGIYNKHLFMKGFNYEMIVFVDEHIAIPEKTLESLRKQSTTLVIRNHTDEPNFNDYNYLSALSLARGEYIMHFDQDTAAFTSSPQPIHDMMDMLEKHEYVSYPSLWSPRAVNDPSFDYDWVSTRFFMCKRKSIDITELRKMQADYNYTYMKYPASRRCHWTEHMIGLLSKSKGGTVYYPPINIDSHAIFNWSSYSKWTLRRLNEMNYDEVKRWIHSKGGIQYPVDVNGD